jgi:hypothetical protein
MATRRKRNQGLRSVAATSAAKAKQAARFIYKNRKQFADAAKLILSVVGAASAALGKPEPSRRRKRKKKS